MSEFERNFFRDNNSLKKEKPEILYHASPRRDIEEFQPRAETVRDPEEGPLVFASPDAKAVTRFLVPVDDSWTQISTFNGIHTIVISDKDRFSRLDKGGAVYSLPPETFTHDETKSKREWTSKFGVKPTAKLEYTSGLEAMIDNGVQVYFVNEETFKQIRSSKDHGLKILEKIESENKKLGKNFVPISTDQIDQ